MTGDVFTLIVGTMIAIVAFGGAELVARVKRKDGVTLPDELDAGAERIIVTAVDVFQRHGLDAIITSGTDGTHRAGSLHYAGKAFDFRRWEADAAGVTAALVDELKTALGPDYDVILESTHIHVEHDPI